MSKPIIKALTKKIVYEPSSFNSLWVKKTSVFPPDSLDIALPSWQHFPIVVDFFLSGTISSLVSYNLICEKEIEKIRVNRIVKIFFVILKNLEINLLR